MPIFIPTKAGKYYLENQRELGESISQTERQPDREEQMTSTRGEVGK